MEILESFLMDFARNIKSVNFYPETHQTLISALQKFADDIRIFAKNEPFVLEFSKDAITHKRTTVMTNHPILRELAQTLIFRKVEKLVFNRDLEVEELQSFLQFLNMDINAIFSAGGMECLIESGHIRNIALSEMQLNRMLSTVREIPVQEKQDVPSEPVSDFGFDRDFAMPGSQDAESAAAPARPAAPAQESSKKDVTLEELWEHLKASLIDAKAAGDTAKYLGNLRETGHLLSGIEWDKDIQMVTMVLQYLIDDISSSDLIPGMRKELERFIVQQITDKRVELLFDIYFENIDNKDLSQRFQNLFTFIGDPAVQVLLNRLSRANDIKTRKMLINEVTSMGDVAFKRVVANIKDDRWFIVRNMVTILGIIGKKEVLPHLFDVASHPDTRVRKEVVKSLARIPEAKTFTFLREMLGKENEEVKLLILFSLGILKDKKSIDDIKGILKSSDSLALKKEALAALGRIGDEQVLPILKTYATKKGFFNKSDQKVLRLVAINGLAEIKTSEAGDILDRLTQDGDPDVRDAAFEGLQKMKYNVK